MKTQVARTLFAAWLAVALAAGPVAPTFAQGNSGDPKPAAAPSTNAASPASLQLSKHDFSRGPSLFKAYHPIGIEQPVLVNSPRIEQLIHDGKLEISLQDAVELALENNLDILVQRYSPWLADTDILRARSSSSAGQALGSIPNQSFDPILTSTFSIDDRNTPVNNPFIAGTGSSAVTSLIVHTSQFNTQYTQGFQTGTSLTAAWNNTRSSTSSPAAIFNPSVQSGLTLTLSQQLLNGFGRLTNTRNIRIAKNNRNIAELQFTQQAINTITNTVNSYWELVFSRENVKVQQRAVDVAEKLYSDNKKQLEIGTMAPLDVVRAESEVATDRQNLIVAQTVLMQQQQALKNAISKNPLDPRILNVEIVPTDQPNRPEPVEAPSFEESVREAFAKRPDLRQLEFNLKNADISVRSSRNALLPTATLSGYYSSSGLAGNQPIFGTPTTVAGSGVVDSTGQPVVVIDQNTGLPTPIFLPSTVLPVLGTNKGGLGDATSQIFHNRFPDYAVALNLNIPLRNRAAQADSQRAILSQRQLEAQMQQLKNAALLDVRNTYIALEQDRARVEAAGQARRLQEQTFDAEQKKYQLGASTVYLVIQTQRDLISAQGNELRALVDLVKDKANYERALGRTLEVNRVTVADAKTGDVERETLIPGTLHGEVARAPKSF